MNGLIIQHSIATNDTHTYIIHVTPFIPTLLSWRGRNDNNLNNDIYRNIKYILALEKLLALRCFCNDR